MSTTRYATLIGLALGAVWAFTGIDGALIAGALAAIGFAIALVMEGRISVDAGDVFGSPKRDRTSV